MGDIAFDGNDNIPDSYLRKIIKLRGPRFLSYQEFNRRSLGFDAITIRTFYKSRGYLNSMITESFQIVGEGRVNILFIIEEGPRSYLRSIVIEGNNLIPEKTIKKLLKLKIGKPFNTVLVRQGLRILEREYRKIGKLYVLVDDSFNADENVEYRLRIEEGPTVKIDDVSIIGLERIKKKLLEREFQFYSNMVYDEEKIEFTQKRIFETGLFSFVNIYPVKSNKGEDRVNLSVEIKEFKSRELISEGGFYPIQTTQGADPIPGIGGTLEWRNRSIFNTGIRFGVKSTIQIPARVDYLFGAKLPLVFRFQTDISSNWIGKLRLPSTLKVFYEDIPELGQPEDDLTKIGIDWNYLQKFSEESIFRGGLRWSIVITEDTTKVKDTENERSIRVNYRFRRINNPITPSKGTVFSVDPSIVGTILGGSRDYYRLEVDYRRYFANKNSWVLALRTKLGWMEPIGKRINESSRLNRIPSYDRFYLGGSTSLRGWATQMFNPDTTENGEITPNGGLIKLLFNSEVRIPIWKRIGINFFLEGGVLATSSSNLKSELTRWKTGNGWDYGIEFTVMTPLGPIRLYYADRIIEDDEPGIWNLGLLYAF